MNKLAPFMLASNPSQHLEFDSRPRRNPPSIPVFGIIKSAMGFTHFHLRGAQKVAAEWLLVALAYNCRRLHRLQPA